MGGLSMLHVAVLASRLVEPGLVPEQQLLRHRLQLPLSAVASALCHASIPRMETPSTTLVQGLPVH